MSCELFSDIIDNTEEKTTEKLIKKYIILTSWKDIIFGIAEE